MQVLGSGFKVLNKTCASTTKESFSVHPHFTLKTFCSNSIMKKSTSSQLSGYLRLVMLLTIIMKVDGIVHEGQHESGYRGLFSEVGAH